MQQNPQRKFRWRYERELWLLAIPPVVWALVFCYAPMYGLVIAFTNYRPGMPLGGGEWIGLKYINQFFSNPVFPMILRNTLAISLLNILVGFPAPIILALLLNELKAGPLKKILQTSYYLPHFISWVVTASLFFTLLSSEGILNSLLEALGMEQEGINFLGKGEYFWGIITAANVWKSMGWSSILYLSAIAGVDQAPTEADITHTADSILAGASTGDFAVALERASAFVDVVAQGLRVEARHMVRQAEAKAGSETATAADLAEAHVMRSRSAKLMHTAGNLIATSKDFRHGAQLWRRGKLD